MSPFQRGLVKWARTVHLYVTLSTLMMVLLFSVTGFMLNHEDWFTPAEPHTLARTGTVPVELLSEPDKLGVAEYLRKEFQVVGLVDSFEVEDDSLRIVFKRPGTEVEAVIRREDGETNVTTRWRGMGGILLDLHRGKSTGMVWSVVIDVVCGVFVVLAATGLILFSSLKGRGRYGLVVLGLGAAASIAIIVVFAL
jgi:hypothetical protein